MADGMLHALQLSDAQAAMTEAEERCSARLAELQAALSDSELHCAARVAEVKETARQVRATAIPHLWTG